MRYMNGHLPDKALFGTYTVEVEQLDMEIINIVQYLGAGEDAPADLHSEEINTVDQNLVCR